MHRIKNSLAACAALSLVIALIALATPTRTRGQGGGNQPPLPVRDANDPARRPFAASAAIPLAAGLGGAYASAPFDVTVPAGTRLVIERVSGSVRVPAGQVVNGGLFVTTNGHLFRHELRFTFGGSTMGQIDGDSFIVSESLRLYADAGTEVVASAVRNAASGEGGGVMTISGYLVDVP